MSHIEKEQLIEEIKHLIDVDNSKSVTINPNYLEYFTLEELIDIKTELVSKKEKENQNKFVEQYVEELSGILQYH